MPHRTNRFNVFMKQKCKEQGKGMKVHQMREYAKLYRQMPQHKKDQLDEIAVLERQTSKESSACLLKSLREIVKKLHGNCNIDVAVYIVSLEEVSTTPRGLTLFGHGKIKNILEKDASLHIRVKDAYSTVPTVQPKKNRNNLMDEVRNHLNAAARKAGMKRFPYKQVRSPNSPYAIENWPVQIALSRNIPSLSKKHLQTILSSDIKLLPSQAKVPVTVQVESLSDALTNTPNSEESIELESQAKVPVTVQVESLSDAMTNTPNSEESIELESPDVPVFLHIENPTEGMELESLSEVVPAIQQPFGSLRDLTVSDTKGQMVPTKSRKKRGRGLMTAALRTKGKTPEDRLVDYLGDGWE